jgi:hypothetical protein
MTMEKRVVFLYTRKARVQAQGEMLYTATKESLTESTPFRAIAKKSLLRCTVLLHDYVYIVMLFAFYGLVMSHTISYSRYTASERHSLSYIDYVSVEHAGPAQVTKFRFHFFSFGRLARVAVFVVSLWEMQQEQNVTILVGFLKCFC